MRHQLYWESESGNDMVKEKTLCYVSGTVKSGHGFDPFGKVIYYHDNLLVPITICRMENHEFYAPFVDGANDDEWM
jgi:hypothetical protein